MIYFIELWNAKPQWKALPKKEREVYIKKVGEAIQDMVKQGVHVLTWSENKTTDPRKATYDYFAVWTIPSEDLADSFLNLIESAGWYSYFEQTNILGSKNEASHVLDTMIEL